MLPVFQQIFTGSIFRKSRPPINRFTTEEAKTLWRRFEPLDALLQMDEEHFVPGFQQRSPMRYHFNDMPKDYTASDFIASWDSTAR